MLELQQSGWHQISILLQVPNDSLARIVQSIVILNDIFGYPLKLAFLPPTHAIWYRDYFFKIT